MKKFYLSFVAFFGAIVFAQATGVDASSFADALKASQIKPVDAYQPNISNSRDTDTSLVVDYDFTDAIDADREGAVYDRFIWPVNNAFQPHVDSGYQMRWINVTFDTLIDNENASFYPLQYATTIDSVQLFISHNNTSGTDGRIIMNIVTNNDLDQFNDDGPIGNVIYRDTILTVTDGVENTPGQLQTIAFYPGVDVQGQGFHIYVTYEGSTADQFFILAGQKDGCGDCFSEYSAVLNNSTMYANFVTANDDFSNVYGRGNSILGADCDEDGTIGTLGSCEVFGPKNFLITPTVSIVATELDLVLSEEIVGDCADEQFILSAAVVGNDAEVTYQWIPSTGLSADDEPVVVATVQDETVDYTVIATDGINSDTAFVTVVNTDVVIELVADKNPINCGELAEITANFSNFTNDLEFEWRDDENAGATRDVINGSYTVDAVNSFGCEATANIAIDINGDYSMAIEGEATPTLNTAVTYTNESAMLNRSNWNWEWSMVKDGQALQTSNEVGSFVAVFGETGIFQMVLDADSVDNCEFSTSRNITVIEGSSFINDPSLQNAVSVHPNPSNGVYTVNVDQNFESGSYKVFNLQGSVLEQASINNATQIDITNQNAGVYFILLEIDGKYATVKVVKE